MRALEVRPFAAPLGAEALPWHSDHSYLSRPAKESILEAVEVPHPGPPTCFVDMYRAWEELPERLRRRVEGARAVHGLTPAFDAAQQRFLKQMSVHCPEALH